MILLVLIAAVCFYQHRKQRPAKMDKKLNVEHANTKENGLTNGHVKKKGMCALSSHLNIFICRKSKFLVWRSKAPKYQIDSDWIKFSLEKNICGELSMQSLLMFCGTKYSWLTYLLDAMERLLICYYVS